MRKLLIAFACAAVAMPAMVFERLLPYAPSPERIAWEEGRTWFHNLKNLWTETLRADAQWWGKFLAFVILSLIVLNIIQFIRYRRETKDED